MPKDPLPPILFLHVGWARLYRGDADDPPLGAFGYIADGNEDPGETLNFKPFRGRCHGYAPHAGLNLARLGAERDAAHADGVLVVFTATNPDGSGRYVVGWYRDARVYPGLTPARPSKHRPDVLCSAKAEGCHLVNVDDRTFFVPSMETGWPGVASAFYANEHLGPKDVRKLLAYVGGKRSKGFAPSGRPEAPEPPIPPGGGGDPEARKQVEEMAVSCVRAHYRDAKWRVDSVESENKGWDLEVTRGRRLILVEVKGRAADGAVVITANEHAAMTAQRTRMAYRLAIVHHALGGSPRLTIFQYAPAGDHWVSEAGEVLVLRPAGAIASFAAR
jgi:hypothetical protein